MNKTNIKELSLAIFDFSCSTIHILLLAVEITETLQSIKDIRCIPLLSWNVKRNKTKKSHLQLHPVVQRFCLQKLGSGCSMMWRSTAFLTAALGRVTFFVLTATLPPSCFVIPCGNDKAAYLTTFGIAPHFSSLFLSKVKSASDYILLFDKSMKTAPPVKTTRCAQMLLGWRLCMHKVFSTLIFLNMHALMTSTNLYKWMYRMQIGRWLGIANWIQTPQHRELWIRYNAFKAGSNAITWVIEHTLNCLYWLCKESPARQDDCVRVSTVFPLM